MIRFLKEVLLPAGLWTYFLAKAAYMGLEITGMDLPGVEALPAGGLLILCVFAMGIGAAFAFLNPRMQPAWLDRFFARIFGADSYRVICRRVNANLLASVVFAVVGGVGLMHTPAAGVPEVNRQVLLSLLCIPAGILIAWAAENKLAGDPRNRIPE